MVNALWWQLIICLVYLMKQSAGFGNELDGLEGTGAVFRAVFKGYVYVVEFFWMKPPTKMCKCFFCFCSFLGFGVEKEKKLSKHLPNWFQLFVLGWEGLWHRMMFFLLVKNMPFLAGHPIQPLKMI